MKNDLYIPLIIQSGLYHVDCQGRVWTSKRNSHGVYTDRWRRAEIKLDRYYQVGWKFPVRVYAQRLIWWWHNGPIPSGLEIDHRDFDGFNNHPLNLFPRTRLENQQLAEKAGRVVHSRYPSTARREGVSEWWQRPGVKEQMTEAARKGWNKRRQQEQTI